MEKDKTVFDPGKTMPENDKTVYEADKTVYEDGKTVPEGNVTVLEASGQTVPEGNVTVLEASSATVSEDDAAHVSLCEMVFSKGESILNTYRVESAAIESGGMGRVWRVHHSGWNVDLAMKQPRAEHFATEKSKSDFTHECQTWINLGLHPNIVSCYYVREIGGIPTIFSEWMDGGSLADIIENGKLYEGTEAEHDERILDLAIQFARGLHFAHECRDENGEPQGLIHQDVKPGNLLLTREWDAKVADFGLAKARAVLTMVESSITEPAECADSNKTMYSPAGGFTPAYCSMEQMDGHKLTRRTDIYSWAVSVMEMYVGSHPWANGIVAGLNCRDYFEKARVLMPEGMKRLLAKCLESEESARPHDFSTVENELLGIYKDVTGNSYPRPVSKAAADTADSLNNRALSFLDLGKPEEAEQCWERALRNNPNHIDSIFNQSLYLWRNGKIEDTEVLEQMRRNIAVAENTLGKELIKQLESECGKNEYGKTEETWIRAEGSVDRVILRDGVLISSHMQCTSHRNQLTIRRWDVDNGALLDTFEYQELQEKLFFEKYDISPDGLYVLTIHYDKKVRVRDIRTGECVAVTQARDARFLSNQVVYCVEKDEILWNFKLNQKSKKDNSDPVFEARQPIVCIKGKSGGLSINHSQTNAKLFEVPVKESDELLYLDLASMRLWTADWRGAVKLWNIKSGRCLRTDYNEKTKYLMDETRHRMIKWRKPLYNDWFEWCAAKLPEAGTPAQWQLSHIMSIAERLSMEKRVLALRQQFKERIENGDIAAALLLHNEMRQIKGFENSAFFRSQNRILNGCCSKKTLHMMQSSWTTKLEGSRITTMKFSQDGDSLYVGSGAGGIKRIDSESGACIGEIQTDQGGTTAMEIVGATICAGTYGGHVERYDLRTGGRIDAPITYGSDEIYPRIIDINKNGKRALSCKNDRIAVINAEDDRELSWYQGYRGAKAMFCPDGINVLTFNNGKRRLEYLENNISFEELHRKDIGAICISADGKYAASAGGEEIFIWDMKTGRHQTRLKSDMGSVSSVKLSADGRFMVVSGYCDSSGKIGAFELWDVSDGKRIFSENLNDIEDAVFSPNGELLAVYSTSGGLFQGHLNMSSEIHAFRLSYTYDFPGFYEWDEGARPYLEIFLTLHPDWTDADFDGLITDLQNRGYGWLRPAGVRVKLMEMCAAQKRASAPVQMQETNYTFDLGKEKKGFFSLFGKKK